LLYGMLVKYLIGNMYMYHGILIHTFGA